MRPTQRQLEEQVRELKPLTERVTSQAQVIEELRAQSALALQQGEAARSRATDVEKRNLQLERQLAAATARAQSQDRVLKEILSRPGKPERKATSKASAGWYETPMSHRAITFICDDLLQQLRFMLELLGEVR